jgi:hypothetical protein
MSAPIDNKTTQKVKETISRMIKSDMRCASVILEPELNEPTELMNTTIARMLPLAVSFKSGKTDTNIFMCDGGCVVLLINYWEQPHNSNGDVAEQHVNDGQCVIIGVMVSPTVHPSFMSDPEPLKTLMDVLTPMGHDSELVIPVSDEINSTYRQPLQLGVRLVNHGSAFKETDQVVQRFYEYMRQLGLIQDEPDEDMGALADAAGIEW